jgi:hypothetical protein
MKILAWIGTVDDWLCDKAQAVADWIQDETGVTCFSLSLAVLFIATVVSMIDIALHYGSRLAAISPVVTLLIYTFILKLNWRSRGEGMNPLRVTGAGYRLLFGSIAIIEVVILAFCLAIGARVNYYEKAYALIYSILFTAGLYFGSCTPKPPKRREAWSWRDLFFLSPSRA